MMVFLAAPRVLRAPGKAGAHTFSTSLLTPGHTRHDLTAGAAEREQLPGSPAVNVLDLPSWPEGEERCTRPFSPLGRLASGLFVP